VGSYTHIRDMAAERGKVLVSMVLEAHIEESSHILTSYLDKRGGEALQ